MNTNLGGSGGGGLTSSSIIGLRAVSTLNPRFSFLNPNDPYRAYYEHKIREWQTKKGKKPIS